MRWSRGYAASLRLDLAQTEILCTFELIQFQNSRLGEYRFALSHGSRLRISQH